MKKIYFLLLMVMGVVQLNAQLYEDFNYTVGGNVGGNTASSGTTNNNWTTHSNSAAGTISVLSGSLNYVGLQASTGNRIAIPGNNSSVPRDINRSAGFVASQNTSYVSFLLNIVNNTQLSTTFGSNGYFFHLSATSGSGAGNFTGKIYARSSNSGANFRIGVSETGNTANEASGDLTFGTTYLVVLKYVYNNTAGNDLATLWVNPSSLGGAEPTGGTAGPGSVNVGSYNSINTGVCIRNASNTPNAEIDEIRTGATWASVTPVGATASVNISDGAIGAGSINQGQTNVVLQRYDLAVTTASAILNGLTVTTAGTYTSTDIVNLKVRYSSDATLDAGDATLSTKTTGLGAGSQVFPSFTSQTIASGNTGYIFVTADVSASATPGNTINVDPTAFSNISFSNSVTKTGTDPVPAGGVKTIAALVPSIAISSASPVAGSINQNSTGNILYGIQLDATINNATLTGVTFTTAGTYQVADLQANSFKLWINSTNSLAGATQLGTGQAIVASGNTISFTGLSTVITNGTTRYLLLTTDVAYNATAGNNISIAATPFSNISFVSGTLTGTDPVAAGADQTIATVTPLVTVTQTGPTATVVANGANNVILYTWNAAVTANTAEINSASFTTAGTYVTGDLVANSFKLHYNSVNSFGTAVQIGSSQPVVASGGTISFTGLTQLINASATGYFWVTADVDVNATAGNTINIAATPLSSIVFATATVSGTDPMAAGGVKTIVVVPAPGDIVINQFNSGYSGTATDEFIELVNKTGRSYDLSALRISYQSSSGGSGGAGGTLSGTLPPYSYWLLSPNATITVGATTALARDGAISSGFANASGQFSLQVISTSTIIDAFGYGSLSGGTFTEGTAAPGPSSNSGYKRNESDDTNDNSADFTSVPVGSTDLRNSESRLLLTGSNLAGGTYSRVYVKGNSTIAGAITASEKLSFISGLLTAGNNNVTTAAITGASPTAYVVTNGTGTLTINNVGASNVLFPVGPDASHYHPATINNSGTADNFSVRVAAAAPVCSPATTAVTATWFITEAVAGGSNCSLTLDYTGAATGATYNAAQAQIIHCNGGTADYHNGSVTGTVATGTGFTSFSPFGISNDLSVLPVLFTSVRASEQSGGIKVEWTNATESNMLAYVVERSTDGIHFSAITTVTARLNNGTRAEYSYFDATAPQGVVYYRIQAKGSDGSQKQSSIVRVNTKGTRTDLAVYPNPVTDGQLSFQANALPRGQYTIRVFNANGQQVYNSQWQHTGGGVTTTISLPASIGKGVYNLQLVGTDRKLTSSFIVH